MSQFESLEAEFGELRDAFGSLVVNVPTVALGAFSATVAAESAMFVGAALLMLSSVSTSQKLPFSNSTRSILFTSLANQSRTVTVSVPRVRTRSNPVRLTETDPGRMPAPNRTTSCVPAES